MPKQKLTPEEKLQAKRAATVKSATPLEVYFDDVEKRMIKGAARRCGVTWEAYVYNTLINMAGRVLE
jgi:hypothetical protein